MQKAQIGIVVGDTVLFAHFFWYVVAEMKRLLVNTLGKSW